MRLSVSSRFHLMDIFEFYALLKYKYVIELRKMIYGKRAFSIHPFIRDLKRSY